MSRFINKALNLTLLKPILFLLLLLSSTIYPCACAQGLIFCSEASLTTLNPQRAPVSNMTSTLSYALYDRLLTMNPKTKKIQSAIGSLIYTENKGLTRVYKIKNNISFQSNNMFKPSRFLNADDVAFSFNRMLDPSSPFFKSKQFFPYITDSESIDFIEKVETRGPNLVVFKLRKPLPNFDNFLAHDNSVILSKEYADTILAQKLPPETIDYKPIGSGPFVVHDFLRDSFVRLTPFHAYHSHKPKLDMLVLRHSTHINKRFSQLFTGECQVMSNPSPSQISLILEKKHKINIEKRSSLFGTFLIFNTSAEGLTQPIERQAIASLIDLNALNRSVYFGYGEFQQNSSIAPAPSHIAKHHLTSSAIQNSNENTDSTSYDSPQHSKLLPRGIAGLTSNLEANPQNGENAKDGDIINPYYNYSPIYLKQKSATDPKIITALTALKGRKLKIILLERVTLGDASLTKTAQFIKSALETQGIHATIKSYGYQTGINQLSKGRHDLALINLFSDNGNIIVPLSRCTNPQFKAPSKNGLQQNFTAWCNKEFDLLAQENAKTRNPEILAQNTQRIRDILSEEMPLLPLVYSFNTFISTNNVKNIKQTPFGGLIFADTYLTQEEER